MEPTTLLVAAMVAVALLGVVWFGVRFWLASTRPVDIKDVHTPSLDRMNRAALEGVADDDEEEDDEEESQVDEEDEEEEEEEDEAPDEAAPKGLTDVVPDEKE